MRLLPDFHGLTRRRHEPALRLKPRQVRDLQAWLEVTPQQIVAAATPDPLAIDRRDRRRQCIGGIEADVRVIGAGRLGLALNARVRDVSADGLSFELPERLQAGEQVHVVIHPPTGRRSIELLCTVRWHRAQDDRFIVGCDAGVDWSDSLCDLVRPHDLPMRVA